MHRLISLRRRISLVIVSSMRILLALILSLAPLFAGADIYRSVDGEGNVVFSDKPGPGAKRIPEQFTPTYQSLPLPRSETGAPSVDSYYTALRFRKPAAGATVRESNDVLTIQLEIVPPLKSRVGHMLVVTVDGNNLSIHNDAGPFTISDLQPGSHTLKAQVIDAAGQVQVSSDIITVTLQRAAEKTGALKPVTASPDENSRRASQDGKRSPMVPAS